MWRANSLEKTLILEKIEGRKRKGFPRMSWLDSITDSMDVNLGRFQEMVKDRLSQHQGLFRWVSSSHQVTKVLEFQLQLQSFQWIFWTDLFLGWTGWISLQSKGLLSLLYHHSSKASILQDSAFFRVRLSHLYMTTRKTIALTRWTFVGRVMSLLFNMLSRLVITFLPRSKFLLISWLQAPSGMILLLVILMAPK